MKGWCEEEEEGRRLGKEEREGENREADVSDCSRSGLDLHRSWIRFQLVSAGLRTNVHRSWSGKNANLM